MELSDLLKVAVRLDASDVFISAAAPLSVKVHGVVRAVNPEALTPEKSRVLAYAMMNAAQREEFEKSKECNFSIHPPNISRFRVNIFMQRGCVGAVLRRISGVIPTLEDLKLPPLIGEVAMQKRGLVLVVGGTGHGKSTTLAAMLSHRNANASDHIITIEDPIEFLHPNNKSIVSQREVGVDTESFEVALKNAVRQAPDMIQIGEIRDAETLQSAISFAETGHLCVATMHAANTYQTFDRIVNLYTGERRGQLLSDLSMNLCALISQRLIPSKGGQRRVAALEIMLNTPMVSEYIRRDELHKILEVMERSNNIRLQTFDQSLYQLYRDGLISAENACRNADSENNLRLRIKLEDGADAKKPDEDIDVQVY